MIGCDSVGFVALYWHCCNTRSQFQRCLYALHIVYNLHPKGHVKRHRFETWTRPLRIVYKTIELWRQTLTVWDKLWRPCRYVVGVHRKLKTAATLFRRRSFPAGVGVRASGKPSPTKRPDNEGRHRIQLINFEGTRTIFNTDRTLLQVKTRNLKQWVINAW